jgi:hypothetical protein
MAARHQSGAGISSRPYRAFHCSGGDNAVMKDFSGFPIPAIQAGDQGKKAQALILEPG